LESNNFSAHIDDNLRLKNMIIYDNEKQIISQYTNIYLTGFIDWSQLI